MLLLSVTGGDLSRPEGHPRWGDAASVQMRKALRIFAANLTARYRVVGRLRAFRASLSNQSAMPSIGANSLSTG